MCEGGPQQDTCGSHVTFSHLEVHDGRVASPPPPNPPPNPPPRPPPPPVMPDAPCPPPPSRPPPRLPLTEHVAYATSVWIDPPDPPPPPPPPPPMLTADLSARASPSATLPHASGLASAAWLLVVAAALLWPVHCFVHLIRNRLVLRQRRPPLEHTDLARACIDLFSLWLVGMGFDPWPERAGLERGDERRAVLDPAPAGDEVGGGADG